MARHWTEILHCSCGARFRDYAAEAKHRHNFPVFCRARREAKTKPRPRPEPKKQEAK